MPSPPVTDGEAGARSSPARAVFLDRDGVLNELVCRQGKWVSPRRLEEFRLLPGVADDVARLRRSGYHVFVVTNQPDVARGLMGVDELEAMTRFVRARLDVDDVVSCTHDDGDRCQCRKPAPGMLLALAARWRVDLADSVMVGDSWKDIEAGRRAGCRTIHVRSRAGPPTDADHVVESLSDAALLVERSLALSRTAK